MALEHLVRCPSSGSRVVLDSTRSGSTLNVADVDKTGEKLKPRARTADEEGRERAYAACGGAPERE